MRIKNEGILNCPEVASRRRASFATFCFYKIEYLKNERSLIVIGVGPSKRSFMSEYLFFLKREYSDQTWRYIKLRSIRKSETSFVCELLLYK